MFNQNASNSFCVQLLKQTAFNLQTKLEKAMMSSAVVGFPASCNTDSNNSSAKFGEGCKVDSTMTRRSFRTNLRDRHRLAQDESMSTSATSELLASRKARDILSVAETLCSFVCKVLFIAFGMSFTDANLCAIKALLVSVLPTAGALSSAADATPTILVLGEASPGSAGSAALAAGDSPRLEGSCFVEGSPLIDGMSIIVEPLAGASVKAFAAPMAFCTSSTQASRSSGSWLQNTNTRRIV
mmetsp:Transcript_127726/g.357622  ORF Transcript_127726/g.357622 Transcript_127726/m.357622 type:complete len:241 (-) Transcript_127726:1833-2555(-)